MILAAITIMEIEHGFHRATTSKRAQHRRDYLDTVFAAIPTEPLTHVVARHAARIDAEAKKQGTVIPLADLLIGITALQLSYAVGTRDERHFRMIPDLRVVRYQTSDRLGTAVLIMDAAGLVVENNRTMPYGEEWLPAVASANEQKFTSYQRDGESGLDYAINRFFASDYGRLQSVDPGAAGVRPSDPQTWNAYVYTT